jgi:Tfp pilus assembly protein PilO
MPNVKHIDRICLIVILIVTISCFSFTVAAGARKRKEITRQNELVSKQLKKLNQVTATLEHVKTRLHETRRKIKSFDEQIPNSPEIGKFLGDVGSMAKEKDVVLISVQPKSQEEEKTLTRTPVQMKFNGAFINIYQLLHEIETMNRIVVMEQMTIAKSKPDPECRVDLVAGILNR